MRFEIVDSAVLVLGDDPNLVSYFDAQAAQWRDHDEPVAVLPETPQRAAIPELSWLHPTIAAASARALVDGYRQTAVLDAVHTVMDQIRELTELSHDGKDLMDRAFAPKGPLIAVADLETESGVNVQKGTLQIAHALVFAVRNPASHRRIELSVEETIEQLAICSFIARRLDDARELRRNSEAAAIGNTQSQSVDGATQQVVS